MKNIIKYNTTNKLSNFLLPFLFVFMFNLSGYSQIITTKKEAQRAEKSKKNTTISTSVKTSKSNSATISNTTSSKTAVEEPKSIPFSKYNLDESEITDYFINPIENYLALQITYNAMDYLGVRYRSGGSSRDGFDCSGFVTTVLNIFDIKMPRSSHEMATMGEKVSKDEAKIGDLIFFKTTSRSRITHVGIISEIQDDDIKFVHSSTSLGVVISSLSEAYYRKTFAQINRILN